MVDKESVSKKISIRTIFLTTILLSIFFTTLALANHVIKTSTGTTSYSVNEDVSYIYNISVNISDANQPANVTQVNITIPSSFTFILNTNGTNVVAYVLTNSTNTLSWTNTSFYLLNGTDVKLFWFNASAATPGNYNITVRTVNSSGTFASNISVTVNDTTAPDTFTFTSPVETDGANISKRGIEVNVSATDNGVIDRIVIRLFNSSQSLINTSTSTAAAASYFVNFTGLSDGFYYFNATVNDTFNKFNNSATRLVNLDTTAPNITLASPSDAASSTTSDYNFTFSVNESNYIPSCILIINDNIFNNITTLNITGGTNGMYNSSFSVATYNWSVNCTDSAGNTGNSTKRTFTVTTSTTSTSSSSSSSSSGDVSFWKKTIAYDTQDFSQKAATTNEYQKGSRLKIKLENQIHYVGVVSLTNTSVTINVSSTPQQAVFLMVMKRNLKLMEIISMIF